MCISSGSLAVFFAVAIGVIRIFFDSVVVVDNPNALIRIYPKVLESVCKDAEAFDGRDPARVSPRGLVAGMKLENDGWKCFNII